MSTAEIRKELHKVIDETDNAEILQAMLTLLVQNRYSTSDTFLSDAQLQIIKQREEKYHKGEEPTETLDEFKKKMNKKYGL